MRSSERVCRCARRHVNSGGVTGGEEKKEEALSSSLIPSTLREMKVEEREMKELRERYKRGEARAIAREEKQRRQVALARVMKRRQQKSGDAEGRSDNAADMSMNHFERMVPRSELKKTGVNTVQVNVGLYCNQACTHCHVESSPKRTETMSLETVDQVLNVLAASPSVVTLDITGVAHGGVFVARHEGRVVFVPDAIPGERIRARLHAPEHA